MPFDVRQLSFFRDEVVLAIVELSHANVTTLPPGKIVGIELGANPDVTATLTIRKSARSPIVTVTLPSSAVAAALILYCVNRKIPLPAKAEKRLERVGESVCLVTKQEIKPKRLQPFEYKSYIPGDDPLPSPQWARQFNPGNLEYCLAWKS